MCIFTFRDIKGITITNVDIKKLVRLIDDAGEIRDKCWYDEFWKKQERNFKGELVRLCRLKEQISENKILLPKSKFHPIKDKKINAEMFELKTKHLRLFAFKHNPLVLLVVNGETKNDQESGANGQDAFKKIVKTYIRSNING